MTITGSEIYWITRLDSICSVLAAIVIICGIAILVLGIACACAKLSDEENEPLPKACKLVLKRTLIVFIITISVGIFIPTTKEMILIKGLPAIVNSDFVQKKVPVEAEAVWNIAKDYVKSKIDEDTKNKK